MDSLEPSSLVPISRACGCQRSKVVANRERERETTVRFRS
jgi:hypothetical protein